MLVFKRGMSFAAAVIAAVLVLSVACIGAAFAEGAPTYEASIGSYGSSSGQFSHPAGIALDAEGNLWVADQGNDRVQKFNEAGEYVSLFGSSGSGNGQFAAPKAIAIDSDGDIWVVDSGNGRLQQFDDEGEFIKAVGSPGSGSGQFSGPEDIAIDAEGNIWVADTYNFRLQQFDDEGEFIKVVNPEGLGAIEPTGIDVGSGGKVWVTDWAHNRVVALSEAGTFVSQFGSAGSGNGEFSHPDGIDVDSKGNVWVGDEGNNRVQKFDEEGEYLDQLGSAGSGEGEFSFGYPFGIVADSGAFIWIADSGNERVQKWSTSSIPFCHAGSASTEENEPLVLEAGTLDCAGEAPLEYKIVTGPEHGEISEFDAETGALTYTPDSKFTGLDSFTFKATNGKGSSAVKTFDIAVGEVAVCHDGEDTTVMGEPLVLEAGTLDCAGEAPLEYEIVTGPEHGEISEFDAETGALTYTPESEYVGPDSFSFRATNPLGTSSTQTFQITVQGPPLCNDGWASTEEDEPLVLEAGALECEGEGPLTYEIVTGPEHGEISEFDAETGALTYTPDSKFTGLDSFTFKAINGIGPSVAKTFEVAVGDLPTCEDGEASAPANQPLVLEAGALDCEGEAPLEYEIVTSPDHGEITEFDPETGELTYAPESGYEGPDSFTFRAINGLGSSEARSFALTVQGPPRCHNGEADTPEGEPLVLEAGALDCEGEGSLTYEIVSGPEHGEVSGLDPETGALTYTPDAEFNGYDSFGFRAVNGAGPSSTKTFGIEVGEITAGTPKFQLSFGGFGFGEGRFKHPTDVAVDEDGHVYVLDGTQYTVQKFTEQGKFIEEFGGYGSGNGDLNHPSALAVDPEGNIWVADSGNDRIEKFGPEGEYLDQFGSSGGGYSGYFAYWEGHGHFNDPGGIAVDAAGNIYVSDSGNHRIQKFDDEGNFLAVHQLVGEVGPGVIVSDPEAGKNVPAGIGVGPNGDVWYVRITGGSSPYGFAIRLSSELEVLGLAEYYAEGALLYHPQALDVDSQGNVWVGDGGKDRVVEYSRTGKFLNAFGKWSGYPGGNFDFGSSFGNFGLDVDAHNRIWVADENNYRVQRWVEPKGQGAVCEDREATTPVDHPLHLTAADLGCEGETPFTYEIVTGPEHGEISGFDAETGALTYTPDPEFYGLDSFVFNATSASGSVMGWAFTLKVGDSPSCQKEGDTTPPETPLPVSLDCTGTTPLEYEIVTGPEHGEISGFDAETGALTYTPDAEYLGLDLFTFKTGNKLGQSRIRTFEISIGEYPRCRNGGIATPLETEAPIALSCIGTKPLEYELLSEPKHGEVTEFDDELGTLTYVPKGSYSGLDSIEFRAANMLGSSPHQVFHVDVGGREPVAAYPFDEGEGEVARDSLRGHDGVIEGPDWVQGVGGTALRFSATENDKVTIPDGKDLHLEDFTIEAEVRPEQSLSDAPVVAKWSPESYGFALYAGGTETEGYAEAAILGPSAEVLASAAASEALPIEVWSQLVMTNDGESLKLFVNGELVDTSASEGVLGEAGPLTVGGSTVPSAQYFDGRIDEVQVYDHALDIKELVSKRDGTPPILSLSGPLAESSGGPLGVEAADLKIEADDGSGSNSSGIKSLSVLVDSEQAASTECPCEMPLAFSYEVEAWGPGPHEVDVIAVDEAGNESQRSLEVDAPDGPSVSLGGSLYERRDQTIGVKPHKLVVKARQTNGSVLAPRPGVKELAITIDGSAFGEPTTQECEEGNCGLEDMWTVDPTELTSGLHTIKAFAVDLQGNSTTRSFKVTIAPSATCADSAVEPSEGCPPAAYDVQHAEEYSVLPGQPREYLSDEWVEPGTYNERKVLEDGGTATRGRVECPGNAELLCGQVRLFAPGDNSGTGFFVTTSSEPDDPYLETITDLAEFRRVDFTEPIASGPIEDALASWQHAPPNHGSEYELFESTEEEEPGEGEGLGLRALWWVDSGTDLPLRRVVEFGGGSSAVVGQRLYFDFDQTAVSSESLPPSFFVQEKPEGMSEVVRDVEDEPGDFEVIEEE